MKSPNLIDIPVLIIFFARPEPLKKVFEQVKLARPSKLYLYQDGARDGRKDDIENINKCREIVSDIDWDCQIFYKYQDQNFGCDPSEFIAQKWMFENEEYGIVLEDDDVPSQSFFPYCKELLEKYKNSSEIGIICGMNNLGEWNTDASYLFTKSGSIWGWATWKKNVDTWDEHYSWLDNQNIKDDLFRYLGKTEYQKLISICLKHKLTGVAHYESILGASVAINKQLNIVPSKNLISNIGIGNNTTHAVDNLNKLPKGLRKIFFMKTNELDFPLKHPIEIKEDLQFFKKINRLMGIGHPWVNLYRRIESLIYRTLSGDFSTIKKKLKM